MASDREDFQLGLGWDLEGIDEGLDAIQNVLARMTTLVDGSSIGSISAFRARGEELARALLTGFAAELRGPVDLADHLMRQLSIDPSQVEGQANRMVAALDRIRTAALAAGMPVSASPQIETGATILGLKALEDQGSRSARQMADVNAQVRLLRSQLNDLRGISIPTGPVFRKNAEGNYNLTPSARQAAASLGESPELTRNARGQVNQMAARAQFAAALASQEAQLRAAMQSLEAARTGVVAGGSLGSLARVASVGTVGLPRPTPPAITYQPTPFAPLNDLGFGTNPFVMGGRPPLALTYQPTPVAPLNDLGRGSNPIVLGEVLSSRTEPQLSRVGNLARGIMGKGVSDDDTVEALQNLGFPAREARAAVNEVSEAMRRLAGASQQAASSTTRAAAAETQAAGGGGGRRGGGGGGVLGDSADYNSEREFRNRLSGYPGSAEDITQAERDMFDRRRTDRLAREDVRSTFRDATDYETAFETEQRKAQEKFVRDSARQTFGPSIEEQAQAERVRSQRATARARAAAFGPQTQEEFDATEEFNARRAAENRQRTFAQARLRNYLDDSSVPLSQRLAASFRGAPPGMEGVAGSTGFRSEFGQGFLGSSERLGYQLGQTAKFSVFYGGAYAALFQLTRGFGIALKAASDFEDGITALNIATGEGRATNERYADSLSEIASSKGLNTGVGAQVGVQAMGLFDLISPEGSVSDRGKAQAALATEVATRIASVSRTDPSQTVTQLAGTSRAFGLPVEDLSRVEDTITFIGRRSGRPPAEILSALSQVGTLASGAGFDKDETAAIIARITSTTGDTPDAVSARLSQIFSKADDPAAMARLRAVGVDTEGTSLRDQFLQLSQLRASGQISEAQEAQTVQAFGRSRSGQALSILLNEQPQIQQLAAGARNATGTGEDAFNEVMRNIGMQIRKLGGDTQELLKDLAETGALDVIYAIVQGLDLLVRAGDQVVDIFNGIPRPLRTAAFAMAEFAVAASLLGNSSTRAARLLGPLLETLGMSADAGGHRVRTAVTGLFRREAAGTVAGATVARYGVDAFGNPLSRDVARAGARAVAGEAGGATVGAGLGASLARLFPSLSGAGGAVAGIGAAGAAAIIAPLVLAYGAAQAFNQDAAAASTFSDAMRAGQGASTVQQLRDAAAKQRQAQKEAQAQQDTSFSDITTLFLAPQINKLGFSGSSQRVAAARQNAADLEQQAKTLEDAKAAALRASPESAFGDFNSLDAVTQGVQTLAEQGYSAAQRIDALNVAFDSMVRKSGHAADALAVVFQGQGAELSATIGGAAGTAVKDTVQRLRDQAASNPIFSPGGNAGIGTALFPALSLGSRALGINPNVNPLALAGDFLTSGLVPGPVGIFASLLSGNNPVSFVKDVIGLGGSNEKDALAAELENKFTPAAQGKVGEAALNALKQRGKDPALGQVLLGKGDVEAMQKAAGAMLAEQLGDTWKDMSKDDRKSLTDSFVSTMRQSLGDFNGGPVSAVGIQAFLQNQNALAALAGQDTALRTGDNVAGTRTTVSQMQTAVARARTALGTMAADDPERAQAERVLHENELELIKAENAAADAQIKRAQSLNALANSRLGLDDKVGRGANDIATLVAQLGQTTNVDDRNALQAQIADKRQQQAMDKVAAQSANALGAIDPRNTKGMLDQQLANLKNLQGQLTPGSEAYGQNLQQIAQVTQQLNQYALDNAAAAANAVTDPTNSVAVTANALADAQRRLTDAQQGGDSLAINRAITSVAQAARASINAQVERYNAIAAAAVNAGDSLGQAQANLLGLEDSFQNTSDPTAKAQIQRQMKDAQLQVDQLLIQRDSTARQVNILPGDNIDAAREQMRVAKQNMQLYAQGTIEWNQQQIAYEQARQQLMDAQVAYNSNLRQLTGDITDPVEQARDRVRDANDRLRRADTPEERAAAQVEVRTAQAGEEAAAFSKRISAVQTAESLGRISHAQYLQYLQSEHDRLSAIAKRTYQQQQQLDQVDQLMKSAADELQGQFNLGDIKLPTVYEVRRSMQVGAGMANSLQDFSSTVVNVNGADFAQVVAYLQKYLGGAAATVRTSTPRKV